MENLPVICILLSNLDDLWFWGTSSGHQKSLPELSRSWPPPPSASMPLTLRHSILIIWLPCFPPICDPRLIVDSYCTCFSPPMLLPKSIMKGAKKFPMGKARRYLQWCLMNTHPLGTSADRFSNSNNVIVDHISCFHHPDNSCVWLCRILYCIRT